MFEADRLGSVARIVGFFHFQHNFCVVWRKREKPGIVIFVMKIRYTDPDHGKIKT